MMRSKNAWGLWRTVSVLGAWAHEYCGAPRGEIGIVVSGGWERRLVVRSLLDGRILGSGSTEAGRAFQAGQDWLPKRWR